MNYHNPPCPLCVTDEKEKEKKIKYCYKDGNRDWWYITLWKIDQHQLDLPDDDAWHFEWAYLLEKEDMGILLDIHKGTIQGQYEDPPKIQDVLTDFMAYISAVVIDFSKYGQELK